MTNQEKRACPICRKLTTEEGNKWWPFCSGRCKTTDLGQWAMESYTIPGRKMSEEEIEARSPNIQASPKP